MLRKLSFVLLAATALVGITPRVGAQSTAGVKASAQKADSLHKDALTAEKNKDYPAAVKMMQTALQLAPNNPEHLAYLSHLESLTTENMSGLAHGKKAIALNPNVGWYYVCAVNNAAALYEYEVAKEYGRKALKFGPKNSTLGQANFDHVKKVLEDIDKRLARPPKEIVLTWKLDPSMQATQTEEIFVAVPTLDLPYQTGRYTLSNASEFRETKVDGNLVLAVKPKGQEPLELKVTLTVLPCDFKALLAKRNDKPLPKEVETCLGASGERLKPDSPPIVKLAKELKAKDDVATVNNILGWIKKNLKYDWPHDHNGPVEEVLARGHGCCGCLSEIFVALCRANGVPARCLRVGMDAYDTPGELAGHTDAEVYIRGVGWVPVLPQNPGSLGHPPDRWFRWYHYGVWNEEPKLTMSEYMSPKARQGTALIYYSEKNIGAVKR